ncbi:dTDP-4-dehydrorhamnose 3,5-epimerase [Geomobilimonas luticola]|uniref:dTDP-4-dehydrorhamnose 3,5-epimerase n=1 Tax=Geomobilimonas luticola TaxID=1114878 RepID=A0ABS5SEH7_9BACT|nr:dTDP-4-dehydrorhamnose 3,5-epimerase [Geomobilimonas luticola]MBT0653785.1 dTDP-4-dehydrorhamnose 3,5-epimerase [Geomobilimonas luticola]
MDIRETAIPGCYELTPPVFRDERGLFVKTFHEEVFARHNLATRYAEEYYSLSGANVLRGLHFQLPPKDHVKLVTCVAGEVFDVVLDLRADSPTYGRFETFSLSDGRANMLYIPAGLAHGFCVTAAPALMLYKVTSVYSPEHDAGIRWDSAGIPWPIDRPVVSARDAGFVPLSAFESPFRYGGGD